ncbi:MAG: hypothetical protein VXV82_05505 [Bacteroidota bacterium]|nr:hypothetical protein [Bacteroidota bacterium]MEC7281417.1 hypothetical protein [Verrucomicrobiota bacterium]
MKVGDVVSEALDFGVDWEEAEKMDQTQRGVIFSKSKGLFHVLWFDTQESSSRTDYWARSKSVKVINEAG